MFQGFGELIGRNGDGLDRGTQKVHHKVWLSLQGLEVGWEDRPLLQGCR